MESKGKGEETVINVEAVKKHMEERGLSQKALAVDMHLTESCVSRMLNGKRSGSLEVLEGLARAFPDVDLRVFLKLESPKSPTWTQKKND